MDKFVYSEVGNEFLK